MKTIRNFAVLSLLALAGLDSAANKARAEVKIDFDTFAAVAYSPATGKFGYAWNWRSRGRADSMALANCNAPDAKVVGWVKAGWLALAVSDDNAYGVGYTFGRGAANTDAMREALNDCSKHSKSVNPPKIKVCLCSGNFEPLVKD